MRKTIARLSLLFLLTFSAFALIPHANAQSTTVSLTPTTVSITQLKQTFTVNITITNVQDLWGWSANITWDPTILSMVGNPQTGGFLEQAGTAQFIATPAHIGATGAETINDVSFSATVGASGSGVLATIEFQVVNQTSTTNIQLIDASAVTPPTKVGAVGGPPITLASDTATTTVSISTGGAPAANAGPAQTVKSGTTVTFDGSKSLSSGTNPTYLWTFTYNGAKENLTGISPTFTFNTPGIYTVPLVVSDSNGSGNATVIITVNNTSKPVAAITVQGYTSGQSIPSGQPITFSGSGSSEADNGTITKYLWAVQGVAAGTNATLAYTFSIPPNTKSETKNVTLTVFDSTNQNNTATDTVTIVPGSSLTAPTSGPTGTTATSTPTSSSSPSPSQTSTPTSPDYTTQAGLPASVIAIVTIITLITLGGSTAWLRKRTS